MKKNETEEVNKKTWSFGCLISLCFAIFNKLGEGIEQMHPIFVLKKKSKKLRMDKYDTEEKTQKKIALRKKPYKLLV